MQRQTKQMILAFVLLLLAVAAYLGMRSHNEKQEEEAAKAEEDAKVFVADVNTDDITAFSYQNEETTLRFVKEEDTWTLQGEEDVKLAQSEITAMLSEVALLEAEEVIENADDLAEYGFDSPVNVITFTTAEGSVTLTIGMENAITNQYYLTKSGDERLYLVSGSFPSVFKRSLEDLKEEEESTESETES